MPSTVRAQVTFQGHSGLPEDQFVNTFHFHDGSATTWSDGALDLMSEHLVNFYNGTGEGQALSLGNWLGGQITSNEPQQIRWYRLYEPEPRVPYVVPFDLVEVNQNENSLPAELAVCLSFYAGANQQRKRGRIYFGPLAQGALDPGASNRDARPAATLRDSMKVAGARLMLEAEGRWAVLSRVDGIARPVTAGWVDDAFDVQRRRGYKASSRLTWGV